MRKERIQRKIEEKRVKSRRQTRGGRRKRKQTAGGGEGKG
jgi:hypothetical protein